MTIRTTTITTLLLAASLAAASASAMADTPRPNPVPVPCVPGQAYCGRGGDSTAVANANPIATGIADASPVVNPTMTNAANGGGGGSATADADASNSLSIGGDNTESIVAVFPPPSTAPVPTAHNCIVTRATAGGIGWNLLQAASSEQYSDPVCVLQWLAITATDAAERAAMRAEIVKRLGVQ